MINYCTKKDTCAGSRLGDVDGCAGIGAVDGARTRAILHRDNAEQVVAQLRQRLERSLKDLTTSISANSTKFSSGVDMESEATQRDVTDGLCTGNEPPVMVRQSADAALIQISGTTQRKLGQGGQSSRFIVSPTPNAMPATKTTIATSRPLSVIVPGTTWTTSSKVMVKGSPKGECASPPLKISTGSFQISRTGVHRNQCSEAIATGSVTTGIVQSSSSSPTNSVDSGVSSPAAYSNVVDEAAHFIHHPHHQHIYQQFHQHHHPIVTVASSTSPPTASGVHVRHHYRSNCHQSVAQISTESRFFQFGINCSPIASVSYSNSNSGVIRQRSASLTESRLLQYSSPCTTCCSCSENSRILIDECLRLDDDECGNCRRSTLSPLCESPRDDTMDVSHDEKIEDEHDNDKTITNGPQFEGESHASILPMTDDVFRKKYEAANGGASVNPLCNTKQQQIAENFERNGINGIRCICTLPTPLSSVAPFTTSQIISCSAPPTPTMFAAPNFCKSTMCCSSRVFSTSSVRSGCSINNNNNGLKGILKKSGANSVSCGCTANGIRGNTTLSRGRFRLSRSVSESAGDDFGDGLSYAFKGIELNEDKSAKNDYLSSSSQLLSDGELMEMDTTEDESSRSSWENGIPPTSNSCGSFDTSRSSTLDGSDSSMNAESSDEKIICELAPRKKRVSFSEHVQARIYRSNASILGQKKKNDKRNRTKRRRAESEGSDAIANNTDTEAEHADICDKANTCGSAKDGTTLCDSCHKPLKVDGYLLGSRRDSGIDDDGGVNCTDEDSAIVVDPMNHNNNSLRCRSCSESTETGQDDDGDSTDILAAKRIRRLVSADSALGDDDVLTTVAVETVVN